MLAYANDNPDRRDVLEFHHDLDAVARIAPGAVTALTEAATKATYYCDGLTEEQVAAIRRIVDLSPHACLAAAENQHQRFFAAFGGGELAGYAIATRHAEADLEVDWLMVHPRHHGSGIARALMQDSCDWLGGDRPLWLNVLRHNERAIRFYRKFGFEIDQEAVTTHVVPHWIMRRTTRAGR